MPEEKLENLKSEALKSEEPKDIFAETEKEATPTPKVSPVAPGPFQRAQEVPKISKRKTLIILIIVFVLLGLGVLALTKFMKPKEVKKELPNEAPLETSPREREQIFTSDLDGDGLSDEEEQNLGTNPENPDTDTDGLSDREEIKVYGTSPLNPDTDNDGIPDGEEVKNGTDPKNPSPGANLLDFERELQRLREEKGLP